MFCLKFFKMYFEFLSFWVIFQLFEVSNFNQNNLLVKKFKNFEKTPEILRVQALQSNKN